MTNNRMATLDKDADRAYDAIFLAAMITVSCGLLLVVFPNNYYANGVGLMGIGLSMVAILVASADLRNTADTLSSEVHDVRRQLINEIQNKQDQ